MVFQGNYLEENRSWHLMFYLLQKLAADLPLSFLFNAERLNRMVQYEAMNKGLGVAEMINMLISKTWKAPRLTGIDGLIQMQTEEVLLTYLLACEY